MGKCWRILATGTCFAAYAVLAWIASVTILPLMIGCSRGATQRRRRARALTGWSFRALLIMAQWLGIGRVTLRGREWLQHDRGKLVLANHPMYLDVIALVAAQPQLCCVTKSRLWHNPWYRRFVCAIGYISNTDGRYLVDQSVKTLRAGESLLLFPEGTRSDRSRPLHFERGAAQIAVRSQCDIIPVIITCEPLALGKGQRWYEVGARRWHLVVDVCPPRSLADWGVDASRPPSLAARDLTRKMETFFCEKLEGK